ncbi:MULTISPECIES: class I SAM-dependent methyltransferase [unclassified Plantibacter]|uniref:class I SAM-dependent methyltransferase n=1 Tax=unclassified Plantibacter TaxID=2624265 RepID=UPI003D3555F0
MSAADPGLTARSKELLAAWDAQQAAYITNREARFTFMLDIVADTIPSDGTILDLACGPGSISARILERLPDATCIAVDVDPVLLELGRQALAEHGDRVTFIDADLWDRDWLLALDGRTPDAVLSSTALHWLPADVLTRVYSDLATVVPEGGIVLNADHLRFEEGRPLFEELSRLDDERTQRQDRRNGAQDWDEWWNELVAVPHFAALAPERERRFSERPPNPELSLGFHVESMRMAGFAEAGPVWQHFDDFIVLARR